MVKPLPINATLDMTLILSNTDRTERDQQANRYRVSANPSGGPQNRPCARRATFHVCRIPNRPAKSAHVNSARSFMHLPLRSDCVTVFSCKQAVRHAKGERCVV